QGETGVDRDGPVRTHSDGASGLQEEHSSDCTGNGSHTPNSPQSPAGFVAEVPEERESGMCGDGLGRRGSGEMVEVGSGGVQEAGPIGFIPDWLKNTLLRAANRPYVNGFESRRPAWA